MFSIRSNLTRRSNRYNIYQPQRYALYVVGKWFGLIGSALLLFSLTVKWYFLLDDSTNSLPNLLTWCLIIGSIAIFFIGVLFVLGLHWYVEKRYNNSLGVDEAENKQKHLKHLKEEYRNQSKKYRKSSWLKWNDKNDNKENNSNINNTANPNSTTIYNTNSTDNSFQIVSADQASFTSNDASNASFSSTKKLVRTNSKFGAPSLPIIDETKQQSSNDHLVQASTSQIAYAAESGSQANQKVDIFDHSAKNQENNHHKSNKTKHMHKLSTGSAKNYILEAFLKQDKEGTISNQMMNSQSMNNQTMNNQTINQQVISVNPLNSINKSINNQIISQLGNQSTISSQPNGAENNAFTNE